MCRPVWRKTKLKGYFTVEASMIIPLVIFLFSVIFHLTFYMYDRCIVSQDAYILAFRGSLCCEKSPGEVKQYIIGSSRQQFGKKYIGVSEFISMAEVNSKMVEVEVSGCTKVSSVEWLLPQKSWKFQVKRKAERICPTECIRKIRLAEKIRKK